MSLHADQRGCLPTESATVIHFSCTFPLFRICQTKVSICGDLFINPRLPFFAERFWVLADYYLNFPPQMFSPYLGKPREQRTFCLFFHLKLLSFGEDVGFLRLLPLMVTLGWACGINSASLWSTPGSQRIVDEKYQSIKILGGKPHPLLMSSLSLGHLLFPGDKDLIIHSELRGHQTPPPHFTEGKLRPRGRNTVFLAEHRISLF